MRKVLVVLAAAVSAALPLGAAASASADTLDQQQTASDSNAGIGSSQSVAQTFTAGISGGLDRVDLLLNHLASPTAPVNVEITNASSTGPGSTVLASNSIPAASIGTTAAFIPVTFASPAPVTAGTQYAIVAYSSDPGNDYGWFYRLADVYAGGIQFHTSTSPPTASSTWLLAGSPAGYDQAFKTYVIPTPTPPATGQRAAAPKRCKKRARKHHWSHQRLKRCKKNANLLPV